MNRTSLLLVVCAVAILSGGAMASWDVSYEADVMPDDSSLGSAAWHTYTCDYSQTSVQGSILHLAKPWTGRSAFYYAGGGGAPAGTAVTAEARVRIAAAAQNSTWGGPARLSVQNSECSILLYMSTDSVSIYGNAKHSVNLTAFHTIRLAMDSNWHYKLWLDGSLLEQDVANYGGTTMGAVTFGATSPDNTVDSYWDYVRYSRSFEPVPEPSSLIALLGGVTGLLARRRFTR